MGKRSAPFLAALAALCPALPAAAQDARAPTAAIELRAMCMADAGRLWGVSLCGPLLVADPQTRVAWASEPDYAGVLIRNGDGYVGVLPASVGIANTGVDWGGVRWTMLVAPLPEDAVARRVLLAHESWHRIQDRLGLGMQSPANAHLETERGRYFLRLELRALATALRSRGVARRRAARDALLLRAERHRWFREAAAEERALDRNEGLASYTGVRLGAGEDAEAFALRTLDAYDDHDAYARAYSYATGPAYGLLLDQYHPRWRTDLGDAAPADILAGAINPPRLGPGAVADAAQRYGGPAIAAEERARADAHLARVAELRSRYTTGPRLTLPLAQMQFEFNPETVTPLDGLGSVYQTLVLRDRWGEFRAEQGALIAVDFTTLTAANPAPNGLSGPGWTLTLAPGWRVGPAQADGSRRIEQVPTRR